MSAYEAGGGTLRDLHDPDFGIRWDTLSDVSTELQQKYFAIREEEGEKGRGRAKKRACSNCRFTTALTKVKRYTTRSR